MNNHTIIHDRLYVAKYGKDLDQTNAILYIHGGPGLNCSAIEYFIQEHNYFGNLNTNLIVYDQRGCGRSKHNAQVNHRDNLNDLAKLVEYLGTQKINLTAIIGHSYGAKLLTDYLIEYDCPIPAIFVGTSDNILTPRINNLLFDLNQLKSTKLERYNDIFKNFSCSSVNELWHQSEIIADVFTQNPNRSYYYWANMEIFELFKKWQSNNQFPTNNDVFVSVRKDIYTNKNFNLNLDKLINQNYLVINGFHDQIMNGYLKVLDDEPRWKIFDKSSHYPHLEENVKFCTTVNNFLE